MDKTGYKSGLNCIWIHSTAFFSSGKNRLQTSDVDDPHTLFADPDPDPVSKKSAWKKKILEQILHFFVFTWTFIVLILKKKEKNLKFNT